MKEDRYVIEIEIIDKDKPKENEIEELKIEHNENKTKDDELNIKALIISISIAICIIYGIFADNDYINLITWVIIGTVFILVMVVLVAWFMYDNKNVIINYIKNMFR